MPTERIRSADEAGAYLEGLILKERRARAPQRRSGLEPMQRLLDRLGRPDGSLSVLRIAGSKGKGSTCLFAEAILEAAGEKVGAFTSPHLERWTERFRIGRREVTGEVFADAVERVRPHVEALRRSEASRPTFFDAVAAVGIVLFADARVDRALLEVGLGGRLDATNAVSAVVDCITTIELEHTDRLGNTLAEIAAEKAGIMQAGAPCVVGRLPAEADEVVDERARALSAPLSRLGVDFEALAVSRAPAHTSLVYSEGAHSFEADIGPPGTHQVDNAALAFAAALRLGGRETGELAAAARRALPRVKLPGRVEILGTDPRLIIDSAHTGGSAAALAEVLDALAPRRVRLVLSVSEGKNLAAVLDALLPRVHSAIATRAEPVRSLAPEALAVAIRAAAPGLPVEAVEDAREALARTRASLAAGELMCVAGSMYLAGIARSALP